MIFFFYGFKGRIILQISVIIAFTFLIDYLFLIQLVYALNGAYCFIFFRKINVGYNRRYRQNDRRDGYNSFFLFIAFPPYQPTSPLVSTLSTRLRFVKINRTTRGMAYKTILVFLRIDLK